MLMARQAQRGQQVAFLGHWTAMLGEACAAMTGASGLLSVAPAWKPVTTGGLSSAATSLSCREMPAESAGCEEGGHDETGLGSIPGASNSSNSPGSWFS